MINISWSGKTCLVFCVCVCVYVHTVARLGMNGSHSNTVVFCHWLPVSSILCHSIRTTLIYYRSPLFRGSLRLVYTSCYSVEKQTFFKPSRLINNLLSYSEKKTQIYYVIRRWFMKYAEIYKAKRLQRGRFTSRRDSHTGTCGFSPVGDMTRHLKG